PYVIAAAEPPDGAVSGSGGAHSRFAILARAVAPGVVNVHTEKTVEVPEFGPFGDLFGGLLGRPGAQFSDPHGAREAPGRRITVPSMGTGFVLSDSGLIVTNHHVVSGVEKIEVVFQDGTHADATVVGSDPKTDIALVQPKAKRDYTPL